MRRTLLCATCGVYLLAAQEIEVKRLPSPDGRRTAIVQERDEYRGDTIYLTTDGKIRDLLPDGTPLVQAARRSIWLGVWLNTSELTFEESCGTGCIVIYRINVDTEVITKLWSGVVDCCIHWSPRKDRVILSARMGSLTMVGIDGTERTLPGCKYVENKGHVGVWYAFEAWVNSGSEARILRIGCDKGCDGRAPLDKVRPGATQLIWDGEKIKGSR